MTSQQYPYHHNIQSCINCGNCSLIHQSFTLEQNTNFSKETVVPIFEANGYIPACTPGQTGDGTLSVQATGTAFPFGTLVVQNVGQNAFNVTVVAENEDDSITHNVPPGAQVAFSGIIRRVDMIHPPSPCRAFFHFDLFLSPPAPF